MANITTVKVPAPDEVNLVLSSRSVILTPSEAQTLGAQLIRGAATARGRAAREALTAHLGRLSNIDPDARTKEA